MIISPSTFPLPAVDVLAQIGGTAESIEDALGAAETVIELAGTVAFAISAALLAGHRRMNFVGVVVFGVLVAVGGGTVRDMLLGDLPVYWVDDPTPLLVAAAAAALTNIALDSGAGAASAVVVGVISGIGGGIIRDSIADRIPAVLASGHFYASAAVTGSALSIALLETSLRPVFASSIAVLWIFAVRVLSIHYGWGYPSSRSATTIGTPELLRNPP